MSRVSQEERDTAYQRGRADAAENKPAPSGGSAGLFETEKEAELRNTRREGHGDKTREMEKK